MARWVYPRNGPRVLVSPGHPLTRIADNGEMRSSAMGCATKKGQAKRLKIYARKGVNARFDKRTSELVFQGGYVAQKRLKEIHGLEID